MAFTRNVNKPLWLSLGSYPIIVERLVRILDADWIWAAADGARNRARRPSCVRRHDSPQRFRQKQSGLWSHVEGLCAELYAELFEPKQSYCESSCCYWMKLLSNAKKYLKVFTRKYADDIYLWVLCKIIMKSLFQRRVVTAPTWIVLGRKKRVRFSPKSEINDFQIKITDDLDWNFEKCYLCVTWGQTVTFRGQFRCCAPSAVSMEGLGEKMAPLTRLKKKLCGTRRFFHRD